MVTYQASLLVQSVAVQSGRFPVLRCRDASLADWPLKSAQDRLCYLLPQFDSLFKTLRFCNQCFVLFVLIILYSLYLEYDSPLVPSASGLAG